MNAAARLLKDMPWITRLALFVLLLNLIVVVFAPLLAPYGEYEVVGGALQPWQAPFLLGTDHLGRDMLSRLLYAIRNTFGLALFINALSFATGGFLGLLSATLGGRRDQLLSRAVDIMMAVPQLVFALLILSIFGTSLTILVVTITIIEATRYFRVARAASLGLVAMDFVEVARLRGEGLWWRVIHELLPNSVGILLAEFGIRFCYICLLISSLSFLGLGLQPPNADLGSLVRETAMLITFGNSTPLVAAGALALMTVSVNFLVDWILHRTSGLQR